MVTWSRFTGLCVLTAISVEGFILVVVIIMKQTTRYFSGLPHDKEREKKNENYIDAVYHSYFIRLVDDFF